MINTKRPTLGPQHPQSASLLIEKTKANIRRSTPDSEALASSDDDQEQLHRSVTMSTHQPAKPTRRPSWLSDTYTTTQRKPSSGSLDILASGSSHPMTSAVDSGATWPIASPGSAHGHSGSASLPWNSAIWSNDNSKKLPARFAEVILSPTSATAPAGALEPLTRTTSSRRDSNSDAAIPFPIPLQPTLKTYRSQSYSVGQMEQEANAAMSASQNSLYYKRPRTGTSIGNIHHRPGRPNFYGFGADDLGLLQEVEDDEDSVVSSDGGARFSNSQARTIEQLAMENALLRQQQGLSSHGGPSSFSGSSNLPPRSSMRAFQLSDSVLEEPDDQSLGDEDRLSSNHSSLSGMGPNRYNGSVENMRNASPEAYANAMASKSPASFKRGHWQSHGGYSFGEPSQSRRHSFADVPRRTLSGNPHDPGNTNADSARARAGFAEPSGLQAESPSYMTGAPAPPEPSRTSSAHGMPAALHPVARPQMAHYGQAPTHVVQNLYLVTFKAARAEFYYVQEGTGLEVNEGDLVIVEADRGTDLGTVAHKNVDGSVARALREHYVQEHFNWLMMFSRQGPSGTAVGARPSSSGNTAKSGMLPGFAAQSGSAEPAATEIKPKLIKRLAQQHEIHTLREKEGNEAKAKRMCQQKVAEHQLNMEILDAEFQMDWKKLTFYYFADSYINFNSLVTDLFKIYKTRIWMSAINPASFVSRNPAALPPTAGASSTYGMRETQFGPRPSSNGSSTGGGGGGGGGGPTSSFMGNAAGMADPSFEGPSWFAPAAGGFAAQSSNPYAQYWGSPGMQSLGQPLGSGRPSMSSPSVMPGYGMTANVDSSSSYADPLQQNLQGLSLGN